MTITWCLPLLVLGQLQATSAQTCPRDVALQRFEDRAISMGSEIKLILYTTDEATAKEATHAVFERFEQLNNILSDYEPDSELNRLCDQAGGPPARVSHDLAQILDRSYRLAETSQGAFDPTIKPLVRLWRRGFRQKKLPDPAELAAARELVGFHDLEVDLSALEVQLKKPGMRLDLGGIAKGYACDEAQKLLKARGIDRALVAAAGDIVVSGPPPGEPGWTIGIGPLEDPLGRADRYLVLKNAAVSTSGDTERFAEIDGKRYSHIVDPRTGLGKVERASVTVVASEGTVSDSLATAIYLLGPDRGFDLADATPGVAALYVRKTGDETEELVSKRWADLSQHSREAGDGPGAGHAAKP